MRADEVGIAVLVGVLGFIIGMVIWELGFNVPSEEHASQNLSAIVVQIYPTHSLIGPEVDFVLAKNKTTRYKAHVILPGVRVGDTVLLDTNYNYNYVQKIIVPHQYEICLETCDGYN